MVSLVFLSFLIYLVKPLLAATEVDYSCFYCVNDVIENCDSSGGSRVEHHFKLMSCFFRKIASLGCGHNVDHTKETMIKSQHCLLDCVLAEKGRYDICRQCFANRVCSVEIDEESEKRQSSRM